jgi:hypothetical protein
MTWLAGTGARQRRPLPAPEQAVHRAVVDLLQRSARPGVAWTHIPSGEKREHQTGAILAGMGHKPGWPDILLIKDGRCYGLELKRERGRLSPAQIAAHEELRAAGATIGVAYGIDEAIGTLKAWGMVR